MGMSRRQFLQGGALAAAGVALSGKSSEANADAPETRIKGLKATTTICPFCGVGCGLVVHAKGGKIVNIEGDPQHPINQGALCSKGSALFQVAVNEQRLQKVMYRAPGSDRWEEKSWDWALDRIALRMKETRDKTFKAKEINKKDNKEYVVNRTEGMAFLGGAGLDNEECYLWSKFARAMGVAWLEHQARLCHSSTVPGLAASFGRGAMTNHWIDIRNSDAILAIGCNPAENHPISFKWIEEAIDKGGKLIAVDPRYTRTASKADVYAQLRPGTDIAFLGGLINYALEHNLIHEEYVREYTNASFVINEKYDFQDGLFCGFDESEKTYDAKSWAYANDAAGNPQRDRTMQNPRCVYQLMKKHFSRYNVDKVCSITGTKKEDFLAVAKTFCATGKADKAGTILYAMGITQSSHGTQNVRATAVLQLLLGNIGIAGGGVNAMRGESNVQGSTDHGLLFHILTGYLKSPEYDNVDLKTYLDKWTPKTKDPKSANWWGNTPKYTVSLLKAWYGDNATKENDFCYDYLPKRSGNYSFTKIFEKMAKGDFEGLVCMGMNPAVGGPDSGTTREALGKLKWLVTADLWETETSIFWKRPGVNPKDIQTEVFMLPAASSVEKEGSISNSGRWVQWRYKAAEPVGVSRSDLDIIDQFAKRITALYAKDGGAFPEPLTKLAWNYGNGHEPDVHLVAKEINGYFTRDTTIVDKDKTLEFKKGDQVPMFKYLQDDGSTISGCWIYAGSYTKEGNQMARRELGDPTGLGLFPKWSWCWPVNRRIVYNRASVNPAGEPFNPNRALLAWDAVEKKWKGDVPDGPWPPMKDDKEGKYPFIMFPEGHARLYALDLKDGPFPEHYEPIESPAHNLLSKVQNNPAVKIPQNVSSDLAKFPFIGTTYRMTEHWQTGGMTRSLTWLNELVPDMFVEISETLAKQKGIKKGDKVSITTERGSLQAMALITSRLKPFNVEGKVIEQIGMPWHFGYAGLATGDSANLLTPSVGCANTSIPEFKAFLCNLEKGGKA